MSYSIHEFPTIPMQPGADMSGTQYCFCKLDSAGLVRPITDATSQAFGVVVNQPSSGTGVNTQFIVSVRNGGVVNLTVDGAYAAGTLICSDATGRGTQAANDGTHNKLIRAQLLEASTAADDIVPALYFNQYIV